MAVNVLWLLMPLCCFAVAIAVPQYLTSAIRYVDILTTSVGGTQTGVGGYEEGTMRSIVQELVEVRMSVMNDEIVRLRQTVLNQEREVEALRLLHESFRKVHDESQQKLSLMNADSELAVHIERLVGRHTDDLVRRFRLDIVADIVAELEIP